MNKQGYTLLEVSLFLAISGALMLVAFVGLGPRLRNVRFTSSVRSLESNVQAQLIATQSGENSATNKCSQSTEPEYKVMLGGTGDAGSSDPCVINGKVVVFRSNRVTYYPIASLRVQNPADPSCASATGFSSVFCYGPTILDSTSSGVVDTPYSNSVVNNTGTIAAFGYIQDPSSTDTYTFSYKPSTVLTVFDSTSSTPGSYPLIKATDVDNSAGTSASACLVLNSRTALFQMQNGTTKPKVTFEGCS